jgi:isopentenyl phosphate kinase
MIPVIYGDCVFDLNRGCTVLSTEQLFAYLSRYLKPSRVLVFGLVNGVYTADPLKHPDVNLIKEIHSLKDVEPYLKDSYSTDVTGGMLTKVKYLIEIAKMGIDCEILGSAHIYNALCGEKGLGTVIKPD